jgi:hypothetical protein
VNDINRYKPIYRVDHYRVHEVARNTLICLIRMLVLRSEMRQVNDR